MNHAPVLYHYFPIKMLKNERGVVFFPKGTVVCFRLLFSQYSYMPVLHESQVSVLIVITFKGAEIGTMKGKCSV